MVVDGLVLSVDDCRLPICLLADGGLRVGCVGVASCVVLAVRLVCWLCDGRLMDVVCWFGVCVCCMLYGARCVYGVGCVGVCRLMCDCVSWCVCAGWCDG